MTNRRTLARQYVLTRLLGHTAAGQNVYDSRIRTIPGYPGINVYIDKAPVDKQDNQSAWIKANLVIECVVKQNTSAMAALDALCDEVLARIPRRARNIWDWSEWLGFELAHGEVNSEEKTYIGTQTFALQWTEDQPLVGVDSEFNVADLDIIAGQLRADGGDFNQMSEGLSD